MEFEKKIKRLKICIVVFFILSVSALAGLLAQLFLAEWNVLKIRFLWLFFLLLLFFGLSLIAVSLCASRVSILSYEMQSVVRCQNCGMECFDNHSYCPACGVKLEK